MNALKILVFFYFSKYIMNRLFLLPKELQQEIYIYDSTRFDFFRIVLREFRIKSVCFHTRHFFSVYYEESWCLMIPTFSHFIFIDYFEENISEKKKRNNTRFSFESNLENKYYKYHFQG